MYEVRCTVSETSRLAEHDWHHDLQGQETQVPAVLTHPSLLGRREPRTNIHLLIGGIIVGSGARGPNIWFLIWFPRHTGTQRLALVAFTGHRMF